MEPARDEYHPALQVAMDAPWHRASEQSGIKV
jgi:hypothetical protein